MNDGEQEEKREWPPDRVLNLVGLNREEWNEMADEIQTDILLENKNKIILAALERTIKRRASEHDGYL